jgi:AcrR family transcriptional regulator
MGASSQQKARFEPALVPAARPGRAGGVRERNRSRRTQQICESALDLFLVRGIEATTVDEITRAAGVAKGTFYRYFNGKPQLVETLLAPLGHEVEVAMQRCSQASAAAASMVELEAAYAALAREVMVVLFASPKVVKLYLQEGRGPSEGAREPVRRLAHKLNEGAVALTEIAHARGLVKDLSARVTAVAVVGAAEGMLVQHFSGMDFGDAAAATADLIAMVLEGIRR